MIAAGQRNKNPPFPYSLNPIPSPFPTLHPLIKSNRELEIRSA